MLPVMPTSARSPIRPAEVVLALATRHSGLAGGGRSSPQGDRHTLISISFGRSATRRPSSRGWLATDLMQGSLCCRPKRVDSQITVFTLGRDGTVRLCPYTVTQARVSDKAAVSFGRDIHLRVGDARDTTPAIQERAGAEANDTRSSRPTHARPVHNPRPKIRRILRGTRN